MNEIGKSNVTLEEVVKKVLETQPNFDIAEEYDEILFRTISTSWVENGKYYLNLWKLKSKADHTTQNDPNSNVISTILF